MAREDVVRGGRECDAMVHFRASKTRWTCRMYALTSLVVRFHPSFRSPNGRLKYCQSAPKGLSAARSSGPPFGLFAIRRGFTCGPVGQVALKSGGISRPNLTTWFLNRPVGVV